MSHGFRKTSSQEMLNFGWIPNVLWGGPWATDLAHGALRRTANNWGEVAPRTRQFASCGVSGEDRGKGGRE